MMPIVVHLVAVVVQSSAPQRKGDWTKYWYIGLPSLVPLFAFVYWLVFLEPGDTNKPKSPKRRG